MLIDRATGIAVKILPRASMNWDELKTSFPNGYVIALDGVVRGGPRIDSKGKYINFDHHDGVVREATMSTCMQVYYAIKGGLMEMFRRNGRICLTLVINDNDQDTSFAIWLLFNYTLFEGVQSIPHMGRLLELTNRLDITGGAFPMNLSETLVREHNWVFKPYTDLRKSGDLAKATTEVMQASLEAVLGRLNKFLMNQAEESELDLRHTILYDSPHYKIVDEIGGNEARYHLFSQGMNAFVSLVATRPDGRYVYTVGRRSRYIPFPVEDLYDDYNAAEGLTRENGWNGSDIVGGASRLLGSSHIWETIRNLTNLRLKKEGIAQ